MNVPKNIQGTKISSAKATKTAQAGRKCEDCERTLSMYNRGKRCGPCEKARNN
jgi:hypothetical protein